MDLISVVIPCFNGMMWLRETLQSVISQGLKNLEIIFIDDGSTDNSSYIVEKEFPFVRLIKIVRQGPSKARNLGTKLSKGSFIQYLDADDLLAPSKLKIQLEALKKSQKDIAYGDWQKLVKFSGAGYVEEENVRREIKDPEIDLFTADFWCPPAAYLFRRSIVEKTRGWNETLPVIQDARFALDCALQGGRFVYCPGRMCSYRVHSSGSVSSRDSMAFVRDCFKNAQDIEAWWEKYGGINEKRRKALMRVYSYVARASFKKDKLIFETAYRVLKKLKPGYVPEGLKHLRLASQLFNYRNAEHIASWYRKTKNILEKIRNKRRE